MLHHNDIAGFYIPVTVYHGSGQTGFDGRIRLGYHIQAIMVFPRVEPAGNGTFHRSEKMQRAKVLLAGLLWVY